MTVVGGGSNTEEGDRAELEALPSVMGQPESHDPTFEIKVLGEAVLPGDTSESVAQLRSLQSEWQDLTISVLLPGYGGWPPLPDDSSGASMSELWAKLASSERRQGGGPRAC